MNLLLTLLIFLAMLPGQPTPVVSAEWQGTTAVIRFAQPGNLWRLGADGTATWLGRFEQADELRLPDGPDDARHPMGGDRYTLADPVTGQPLGNAVLPRPEVRLPIVIGQFTWSSNPQPAAVVGQFVQP